jgi:hypothetical protein
MLAEGDPVSENPHAILPLAAMEGLAENSRPGFTTKEISSYPGSSEVDFKTLSRIQTSLRSEGIGSRCQSLNRYAYALNNPTTNIDPLGLDPCTTGVDQNGNPVVYCPPTTVTVTGSSGCDLSDPVCQFEWELLYEGLAGPPPPSPTSGGGGGSSSAPPQVQTAPLSQIIEQRFGCAANFGDQYSLAGFLGLQNNPWANAFLGNSVSGLVNLGLSIFGNGPAPSPTQTLLTSIGLPTGGVGAAGIAGMAQGAAAQAFFNSLPSQTEPFVTGLTGAAAVPSPVPIYELSVTGATADLGAEVGSTAADVFGGAAAWAKFGIDFAVDVYALSPFGPCY